MRPRLLKFSAFGPYAGTEEVNFDDLADHGLFVVSGPTGSGKSSIFNALCYALYGSFPGEHSGERFVRSQHAPAGDPCEVQLQFEASGTQWRVTRRSAYERPKKRGEGTVAVTGEATLSRLKDEAWSVEVAKVQEVNQRCEELVGLDLEQFQRVVLLPQGGFSRVLNASAKERRTLLRKLFSSGQFERAVEILKTQSREASGMVAEQVQAYSMQLSLAEASVRATLDALCEECPDQAEGDAILLDVLVKETVAPALIRAEEKAASADLVRASASSKLTEARSVIEAQDRKAVYTSELQGLQGSAELMRQHLDEANMATSATSVLKASKLFDGFATEAQTQSDALAEKRSVCESLLGASELPELLTSQKLQSMSSAVEVKKKALEILVSTSESIVTRRTALDGESQRLELLATQLKQMTTEQQALVADQVSASDELNSLRLLGSELDSAKQAYTNAQRIADTFADWTEAVEAADGHASDLQKLAEKATELSSARALANTELDRMTELSAVLPALQARYEDLTAQLKSERRIVAIKTELTAIATRVADAASDHAAQMKAFVADAAPRLAAELQEGHACSVCGSTEHPCPADANSSTLVGLHDLESASSELSAATAEQHGLVAEQSLLEDALSGAGARGSDAVSSLLAAASKERLEAEDSEKGLAEAQRNVEAIDAEQLQITKQQEQADRSRLSASARATALHDQLGDNANCDLAVLTSAQTLAQERLTRVSEAANSVAQSKERLGQLAEEVSALSEASEKIKEEFTGRDAVLSNDLKRLAEDQRDHEDKVGDLDLVQESERLFATAQGLEDMLAQLQLCDRTQVALDQQRKLLGEALDASPFSTLKDAVLAEREAEEIARLTGLHATWSERTTELTTLLLAIGEQDLPEDRPDLAALEAGLALAATSYNGLLESKLAAEAHMLAAETAFAKMTATDVDIGAAREYAEQLAQVAQVCSGTNAKRIPLESWVLAAYLREVVQQANLHLRPMSSGRYTLVVGEEAVDKRSASGLDIEVLDAHTGRRRSSQSLSGGETFQASLALALGLADVVGAGRSGLHFDCVFVDEGFGSLDPDALELAITVLDGLRSRGALVGVITHVAALKDALPVGIQVEVNANGSGSRLVQLL